MNIFTEIKLLLAANNAIKEVSMVKSGIFTTEFWVTVSTMAVSILSQYGNLIPPPWGIVATAVVGAIYTISRAFVKTSANTANPVVSTTTTSVAK